MKPCATLFAAARGAGYTPPRRTSSPSIKPAVRPAPVKTAKPPAPAAPKVKTAEPQLSPSQRYLKLREEDAVAADTLARADGLRIYRSMMHEDFRAAAKFFNQYRRHILTGWDR